MPVSANELFSSSLPLLYPRWFISFSLHATLRTQNLISFRFTSFFHTWTEVTLRPVPAQHIFLGYKISYFPPRDII